MSVQCSSRTWCGSQRGFSLIELMVTAGVVAILAAIAVPNLRGVIAANRLRAQTDEVLASLQLARSEAVKRNSIIDVCRTINGTSCAGAVGPWAQWLVIDTQPRSGGEAAGILGSAVTNPAIAISANQARVRFQPSGMVATATTINICAPTTLVPNNVRVVSALVGGALANTENNTGGVCP